MATVICRTEEFQPMRNSYWSPIPPREKHTWTHEGNCKVGLYLHLGTTPQYDGAWFLKEAIGWAEALEEFGDLIEPAQRLLDLPVSEQYFVHPEPEDLEAARTIAREACSYWEMCGYASDLDGSEEDQMCGAIAEGGGGSGFLMCWLGTSESTKTVEVLG